MRKLLWVAVLGLQACSLVSTPKPRSTAPGRAAAADTGNSAEGDTATPDRMGNKIVFELPKTQPELELAIQLTQAQALCQEVDLLNRYVRDAAVARGGTEPDTTGETAKGGTGTNEGKNTDQAPCHESAFLNLLRDAAAAAAIAPPKTPRPRRFAPISVCESYATWLATSGLQGILAVDEVAWVDHEWEVTLLLSTTEPHNEVHLSKLWNDLIAELGPTLALRMIYRMADELDVTPSAVNLRIVAETTNPYCELTYRLNDESLDRLDHLYCTTDYTRQYRDEFAREYEMGWSGGGSEGSEVAATMSSVVTSGQRLLAASEVYLRDRFARGRVQVDSRPNILLLTADALRDEVLLGAHRWEKLQLVIVNIEGDPSQLVVTIDGSYAPGIGSTPPPAKSYTRPMDLEHYPELIGYLGDLLTTLKRLEVDK